MQNDTPTSSLFRSTSMGLKFIKNIPFHFLLDPVYTTLKTSLTRVYKLLIWGLHIDQIDVINEKKVIIFVKS